MELGAGEVNVRSDSELIVRQINGQYRVKTATLKPLYQNVMQLKTRFKVFSITHVPRSQNKEADRLTNIALDRV